jgi:hypothetical protein
VKLFCGIIITLFAGTAYNYGPETGLLLASVVGILAVVPLMILKMRTRWWLEVHGHIPRK